MPFNGTSIITRTRCDDSGRLNRPSKSVMPGMSGVRGWDRKQVAVIKNRVVTVSPPPAQPARPGHPRPNGRVPR
jgi:hypothetical protein